MRPELRIEPQVYILVSLYLLLLPLQWFFAIVTAALVHECGHLLALWLTDTPIRSITLRSFGACIRSAPMTKGESILCSLAGPFAGGLLILLHPIAPRLAICAAVQTVYNLLPLRSLDGGQVLLALKR